MGLTDLVGRTFPVVIEGRVPDRDDEIVAGNRTLGDLGQSVGDTVTVDAGMGRQEMTIVGVAAFSRINRVPSTGWGWAPAPRYGGGVAVV